MDAQFQESSIRRIRSAGDLPRRPDRVHLRSNSRTSINIPLITTISLPSSSNAPSPPNLTIPALTNPPEPDDLQIHPPQVEINLNVVEPVPANNSLFVRLMMFLGIGRRATRARKSLVTLVWNVSWGVVQIVVIITLLSLSGTRFRSKTDIAITEWTACDRPLGIWSSVWVVRMMLFTVLSYWEFTRDRIRQRQNVHIDAETANPQPQPPIEASPNSGAGVVAQQLPTSGPSSASPEAPSLSHNTLYTRSLTLLQSLMTFSWFLTAHILVYASISTCQRTSPHIWWLAFGILCTMYIAILEVVLLGFVVLVVAPILFIFWNIFLICIGRHPLQNPNAIRPEIGKLPKSVVERIPLVMYIPSPPNPEMNNVVSSNINSYPPRPTQETSNSPSRRFKLFSKLSKTKKDAENNVNEKKEENADDGPISWEENWEKSEYPFVALEGNRAACAICLMDFEEPKRKHLSNNEELQLPMMAGSPDGDAHLSEEHRVKQEQLMLEDAGEGAQPLRLLACGHVFHKICLDPWLTDVSGRCPVCQRPVEIPKHRKKKS